MSTGLRVILYLLPGATLGAIAFHFLAVARRTRVDSDAPRWTRRALSLSTFIIGTVALALTALAIALSLIVSGN